MTEQMSHGPRNPERSFGLSVGGVLLVIAGALWLRHRVTRAEVVGGIGAVLFVAGALAPRLLKWPSAAWWRFSRALGYVNARVLLTLLFGVVLVPVSALWKLTGKDPLRRRREAFDGWTPYPARYRDRTHYERMF